MRRCPAVPVCLLALCIALPALAQEAPAEEPNAVERIREDVQSIADHLGNLEVRMRYVAARGGGSQLQTRDAATVQFPLLECCEVNLKAIERHTALVLDALRVLEAEHRLEADNEGRAAVVHAAEALKGFYDAYRQLKNARQTASAELMRKTCVREFNHFQRELDAYESCCFVADATAEPEPETKKKKRRKERGKDADSGN